MKEFINKLKKKFKSFKWDRANIIFTIGLVMLLIPISFFGWVLLSAKQNTGKVQSGNRFAGDLDPAITEAQLQQLDEVLATNGNVDKVDIELQTATLKIYLDVKDEIAPETYVDTVRSTYDEVIKVLPVDPYFKRIEGVKRQYDLEIHAYNKVEKDDNFVYYIYKQSAQMAEPQLQLVSKPVDPAYTEKVLAHYAEIKAEKEKPTEDVNELPGENSNESEGSGQ